MLKIVLFLFLIETPYMTSVHILFEMQMYKNSFELYYLIFA